MKTKTTSTARFILMSLILLGVGFFTVRLLDTQFSVSIETVPLPTSQLGRLVIRLARNTLQHAKHGITQDKHSQGQRSILLVCDNRTNQEHNRGRKRNSGKPRRTQRSKR